MEGTIQSASSTAESIRKIVDATKDSPEGAECLGNRLFHGAQVSQKRRKSAQKCTLSAM
jgi:hypothetical protein